MISNLYDLGIIDLSDCVVVSDPCYSRDVWCMAIGVKTVPGKYHSYAVEYTAPNWGVRIAALLCYNTDIHKNISHIITEKWEEISATIGVDSGQAGIFDDTIYPKDKDVGEYGDSKSFYGEACDITLINPHCGIMKNNKAVVASSGIGDGSYTLYATPHEQGIYSAFLLDFYMLDEGQDIFKEILKITNNLESEKNKGQASKSIAATMLKNMKEKYGK